MRYNNVFDIIGPVMIGPSSSHTAGAARIGRTARTIFGRQPAQAEITLYGSFAKTHQGHGTDLALVGGILDFNTYDRRIVHALDIAKELGVNVHFNIVNEEMEHPNTARIKLSDQDGSLEIVGVSLGGGKISITELNGFKIELSGENPTLFVPHEDRYGMIALVADILAKYRVNIGNMANYRKTKGDMAMMVIETDQELPLEALREIRSLPHTYSITVLKP